ncbi:hypothetical protein V2J09_013656 [Rumex salicifolius]
MADTSAVAGAAKSIASALITEFKYLNEVEDEVRALQSHLECMQEFLQSVDANPYLHKQDGQLRIFTKQMRELAFRAEDAIDTYLIDMESKIYKKNFFCKFGCIMSHSYPIHMLRKEIDAIQHQIDAAISRSEKYRKMMPDNPQRQGANIGSSSSRPIAENFLHLDDEFVVGIEDDVTRLVKRLTDPEDDFKVLGIVGTGGAGKTTLASQIYRDGKVQSSFSHRAFVTVSQQWSRLDLIRRISKDVIGDFEITSSETELGKKIHDSLKDKRCLVVLDDIWKKEAWDAIYHIFPNTKGFRAILTTRNTEVPLYTDNKCVLHEPQSLTDDQMWALFNEGAMKGRHGIENNAEFEKLGKQMLKECKGLPLAVVTLAGILRTKQHLYEWERISVACTDNILKERGGSNYGVVENMIELSYLDLPTHLKPLFLYLAIIPEDVIFSSEKLTQMWIAEGFVADDQEMRCETLEDKAMWFLSELAQRYIIQVTRRNHQNQIEFLRLHDLMREFCIKKATEYQFFEIVTSTHSHVERLPKARRLSISSREYSLEENHYLRTVVYNGIWYGEGIGKLESIHKNSKLLRVLSINRGVNYRLPKKIGNLVHLTYLSLVLDKIEELPESIRNLRNLIYFVCRFIPFAEQKMKNIIENMDLFEVLVPNNLVENMKNLRVLELVPNDELPNRYLKSSRLGLSSERHKNLHSFKCGAGKWMKKDLPMLSPTVRDLELSNIKKMEEMEEIYKCLSLLKGSLHTFTCRFFAEAAAVFNPEKLRDCESLCNLRLDGQLANNGSFQFPPNLVSLCLFYSQIREGVNLMEVLGQLSKLKFLRLGCSTYLGTQLSCAGTAFPQLQELKFIRMFNLEEWRVEGQAMGRLKVITISRCWNLKRLPERLGSITTLKELQIKDMPLEFCKRLGYKGDEDGESTTAVAVGGGEKGEDSYIIQNIPSVKFVFGAPWSGEQWN